LLVGTLLLAAVGTCQEVLVFPAVTANEPGLYDSLWATQARVVKVNWSDPVTVRRKWVCLPDGGFVDDPDAAPVWSVGGRVAVLNGGDLLAGTGASIGAVAFEVEGGPVLAHAYVADVSRGLSGYFSGVYGPGQLTPAFREPLRGPSHIPWLGGCRNTPCALTSPERWNFLRNNIGIVNPNPEPLTVRGTVIPFAYTWPFNRFTEVFDVRGPETFERVVPPYGWMQFPWAATHDYFNPFDTYYPPVGFIIGLTPEPDLPYYAYASVVFTPDPASGMPPFSDPMYVPAEPGYIAPAD
jgi:hypothetical protein